MQPQNTTQSIPTFKRCTKCGEIKPCSEFGKSRTHAGGLRSQCKDCVHVQKRVHYAANRARLLEQKSAYAAANKERIAERDRAYRAANRERMAERHHAYRAANRERLLAQKRARYAENRERAAQAMHAYYVANKEEKAEYDRAYRTSNPHIHKAKKARRRARLHAAEGTHTSADIRMQYEKQEGRCFYCGVEVGDTYHVDHVVPLSRGGSNWPENLVIACPPCNISKGNKLLSVI